MASLLSPSTSPDLGDDADLSPQALVFLQKLDPDLARTLVDRLLRDAQHWRVIKRAYEAGVMPTLGSEHRFLLAGHAQQQPAAAAFLRRVVEEDAESSAGDVFHRLLKAVSEQDLVTYRQLIHRVGPMDEMVDRTSLPAAWRLKKFFPDNKGDKTVRVSRFAAIVGTLELREHLMDGFSAWMQPLAETLSPSAMAPAVEIRSSRQPEAVRIYRHMDIGTRVPHVLTHLLEVSKARGELDRHPVAFSATVEQMIEDHLSPYQKAVPVRNLNDLGKKLSTFAQAGILPTRKALSRPVHITWGASSDRGIRRSATVPLEMAFPYDEFLGGVEFLSTGQGPVPVSLWTHIAHSYKRSAATILQNFGQAGFDVGAADSFYGISALHVAAHRFDLPLVQTLVMAGAPVDGLDARGQDAAAWAGQGRTTDANPTRENLSAKMRAFLQSSRAFLAIEQSTRSSNLAVAPL